MLEEALAAVGLTKPATIGGFMGAVVSVALKLVGSLNLWQAALSVAGGTLFAGYVTPLVLEVLVLTQRTESGIAFLIGAFGLLSAAALVKALPELLPQMIKDLWEALITRIRGSRRDSGRGEQ